MRLSAIMLVLALLSGCSSMGKHMFIPYDDLSPAHVSEELLFPPYWSWKTCGCGDPNKKELINVVVYNQNLEAAMEAYPIDENAKQDYRYLSVCEAYGVLDRTIASMREYSEGGSAYTASIDRMQKIRTKIEGSFGAGHCSGKSNEG